MKGSTGRLKWLAVGLVLSFLLAPKIAFAQDPEPCRHTEYIIAYDANGFAGFAANLCLGGFRGGLTELESREVQQVFENLWRINYLPETEGVWSIFMSDICALAIGRKENGPRLEDLDTLIRNQCNPSTRSQVEPIEINQLFIDYEGSDVNEQILQRERAQWEARIKARQGELDWRNIRHLLLNTVYATIGIGITLGGVLLIVRGSLARPVDWTKLIAGLLLITPAIIATILFILVSIYGIPGM